MSERADTYPEIVADLSARCEMLNGRLVEAECERDYFMREIEKLRVLLEARICPSCGTRYPDHAAAAAEGGCPAAAGDG